MRHFLFFLSLLLFVIFAPALAAQSPSFQNQANTLIGSQTGYSSVALGVCDMNGDGLDDVIRTPSGSNVSIHTQGAENARMEVHRAFSTNRNIWSLVAGHLTGSTGRDVLIGHTTDLQLWQDNGSGAYNLISVDQGIFVQGLNLVELLGGGELNVFACHDVGLSRAYYWSGSQLVNSPGIIDAYSTVPSDNSGNYSSTWVDYDDDGDLDLYLAKCRGGVTNPMDGRRLNQMFQNQGDGTFVDVAQQIGLLPMLQSWSATFADVDNDGDQDAFIQNHDGFSQLLENDGTGNFTDRTPLDMQTRLAGNGGWQVGFADLNNDGFQELIHSGRTSGLVIYENNGDWNWSEASPGHYATSFAHGDLNNDGFIDLLTSEGYLSSGGGNPDGLLINEGNDNHFLKLSLTGTASNQDAIGARTYIYGDWGVQTREVRAGESYGIQHSFTQHFGLGAATDIDSIVIHWPSGLTERRFNVGIDQTLTLLEGAVTLPAEFTGFTARATKDGHRLDWSVAEQHDVAHYLVEAGSDGRTFVTVGQVPAGRSAVATYAYTEATPPAGDRYYRIRTVDLDGSTDVSAIRLVPGPDTDGFRVFPNPATEGFSVFVSGKQTVAIYATDGRLMAERAVEGTLRVKTAEWPAGIYLVRVGEDLRRVRVN